VRELRQAVFRYPGRDRLALNPRAIRLRRTPEDSLGYPVGLAEELPLITEGIEHFDRAAGDAVGLTDPERAVETLDESRGLCLGKSN